MNRPTNCFRDFNPNRIGGHREHWIDVLTGRNTDAAYPASITPPGAGGKFTPGGAVLSHPGNTFLCHLSPGTLAHRAMAEFQRLLLELPSARYCTPLPQASFHMTVFCGVSGDPLGTDGWPSGLAADASLRVVNDCFMSRLEGLTLPGPFTVNATCPREGFVLHLEPRDRASHDALWSCRDKLRDLTGLDRADHDDYGFHVSLAYLTAHMPVDIADRHLRDVEEIFAALSPDMQDIQLGPVEFCSFETMHHFEPLMVIPQQPVTSC
ncbi:DUF1868 domain-containing protein [Paracoccus albus]|uniref:DUF1868 domain-containing protein n=1 Tax=Paracoccus albus TaxID=3017784 RepID=UPI0022F125DA|nr:DUF1868 domain-containing protein [Paracoccus albus]WBU60846.1 DUF1868 domain-containing protein [Paracoccus albus]